MPLQIPVTVAMYIHNSYCQVLHPIGFKGPVINYREGGLQKKGGRTGKVLAMLRRGAQQVLD